MRNARSIRPLPHLALIVLFAAVGPLIVSGCGEPQGRSDTPVAVAEQAGLLRAGAGRLDIAVCSGGAACLACDDNALKGLRLTPKHYVQCNKAKSSNPKECEDPDAEIQWRFLVDPSSNQKYKASITYDDAKKTPIDAIAETYCASGCTEESNGNHITIKSGQPIFKDETKTAVWPYRLDLWKIDGTTETKIACADPEIIVDPPGGGSGRGAPGAGDGP